MEQALGKLARPAHSPELRTALNHLEETREHVERLQQVFEGLNEKAWRNGWALAHRAADRCGERRREQPWPRATARVWFTIWIALNRLSARPFDLYPFPRSP